ncbi:GABP2 protein, partial [Thinocorus orbignyianus]|nr:GABP2 protein [Thinocorus orbignyianus]
TTELGTSLLHLAARNGHCSTAEVLLQAGLSGDARTKVDRTPLHMAAADGHAHVVELLIRLGTSLLHLAARNGHCSTAEVLLQAGLSGDARTKVDRTPLHMAAADGHAHVVELLIRAAMRSQPCSHPESTDPIANTLTLASPFILTSGEVLNLAGLVSSGNPRTT